MGFEAAIQTQRNALLRLLAGWLAAVALLSAAPLSPVWSWRARVFLAGVVGRAEAAARYLVMAQARLTARRLGMADPLRCARLFADPLLALDSEADEPPSLAELRARLRALRCLLGNLPCRGMRLLQRMKTRRRRDHVSAARAPALSAIRRLARRPAVDQCGPLSPWHPPKSPCAVPAGP